jgi:tetrapyrrole methylase family protein / MazG family protein
MSDSKDWVQEIVNIMAQLRAPNGCPWDQEQTHISLKPYLIEESCEVIDAIDDGDMKNLEEELGDVLMNIVFHAQLASEKGLFTFQDVARNISEKMIRRHPHVFGDSHLTSSADVEKQWQEIKREEKSERTSALEGIPRSLPPLYRAQKLQKRAAKVGFDWPDFNGPLEKIDEELAELKAEIKAGNQEKIEEEFGDLLFSMVNLSRHLKIDSGNALNLANRKFIDRFTSIEEIAKERNQNFESLSLEQMDTIWNEVKKRKNS